MLGQVNYITSNDYQVQGPYDEIEGSDFENKMHKLISNYIQNYFIQGLRLKKTPNTRDDGKDMIITSPVEFVLWGKEFKHKNRNDIEYEVDMDKYLIGGVCGIDKHTKFAISSRLFSIYGNSPTLTASNTADNSKIVVESEVE